VDADLYEEPPQPPPQPSPQKNKKRKNGKGKTNWVSHKKTHTTATATGTATSLNREVTHSTIPQSETLDLTQIFTLMKNKASLRGLMIPDVSWVIFEKYFVFDYLFASPEVYPFFCFWDYLYGKDGVIKTKKKRGKDKDDPEEYHFEEYYISYNEIQAPRPHFCLCGKNDKGFFLENISHRLIEIQDNIWELHMNAQ